MKKYTDHERTTEQELLALDSIYKVLNLEERIFLHRKIENVKIFKFLKWIEDSNWKSPYMKYPEFHPDQLYYEDENGELQPLTAYPKLNPEITEQILKL